MERKAVHIITYGPAEKLVVKSEPVKSPGAGEVFIEVHYSGINFADIIMRLGLYQDAPPKPFIPGYEVSGKVLEVGPGVSRFKAGDEIMAGTRFGGYASHVTLPENQVFKLPKGMNLREAAALPVNYLTSHIALHEFGRVRKGDKVLIETATGGVGVIALQMAKAAGASVIGLTSTPEKRSFIEAYGATGMTHGEFENSNVKDFDFILSSSGGSKLKLQYGRLTKAGKIVCIGLQDAIQDGKGSKLSMLTKAVTSPIYSILKLTMDSKMMGGFNALKFFDDAPWLARAMKGIEDTTFHPHIGGVFPAAKVAEAHKFLENKKAKGKVLLSWVEN